LAQVRDEYMPLPARRQPPHDFSAPQLRHMAVCGILPSFSTLEHRKPRRIFQSTFVCGLQDRDSLAYALGVGDDGM
jgi:hypothetical protein